MQIRDCLLTAFEGHSEKLQSAVEVLKQVSRGAGLQVIFSRGHDDAS